MASEEILNNCNSKMNKAFEIFKNDLSSLRTGRANVSMLDIVMMVVMHGILMDMMKNIFIIIGVGVDIKMGIFY